VAGAAADSGGWWQSIQPYLTTKWIAIAVLAVALIYAGWRFPLRHSRSNENASLPPWIARLGTVLGPEGLNTGRGTRPGDALAVGEVSPPSPSLINPALTASDSRVVQRKG
jgi:hypothetical protein